MHGLERQDLPDTAGRARPRHGRILDEPGPAGIRQLGAHISHRKPHFGMPFPLLLSLLCPVLFSALLSGNTASCSGAQTCRGKITRPVHTLFFIIPGEPGSVLPEFIARNGISFLVTDFDPLRIKRQWREDCRANRSLSRFMRLMPII